MFFLSQKENFFLPDFGSPIVVPIQPYRVIGFPKKNRQCVRKQNQMASAGRYLHAGEFEDFSNDIYSCNKIIAETDNVSAVEESSL